MMFKSLVKGNMFATFPYGSVFEVSYYGHLYIYVAQFNFFFTVTSNVAGFDRIVFIVIWGAIDSANEFGSRTNCYLKPD